MENLKMSIEESKQIAATILQQLGGRRFLAMTGCKNLVCDGLTASMKLTRNKAGAGWLKITLNSMDLYNMEFVKLTKNKLVIVEQFSNVYDDQLAEIFTNVTGLYTRL